MWYGWGWLSEWLWGVLWFLGRHSGSQLNMSGILISLSLKLKSIIIRGQLTVTDCLLVAQRPSTRIKTNDVRFCLDKCVDYVIWRVIFMSRSNGYQINWAGQFANVVNSILAAVVGWFFKGLLPDYREFQKVGSPRDEWEEFTRTQIIYNNINQLETSYPERRTI